jgi:hypothetical protein
LQGDNNTAFFQRAVNGAKRKRIIFSLTNGGKTIHDIDALLNHATDFYKKLFGPAHDVVVRLSDGIFSDDEKLDETNRHAWTDVSGKKKLEGLWIIWRRRRLHTPMLSQLNFISVNGKS